MFSKIFKTLPVSFVVAFLLSVSPLLAQAPAIEVHFSPKGGCEAVIVRAIEHAEKYSDNWKTEKEHCREYRATVSQARDPYLPDPNLTPGKVRSGWTLAMTEAKGGTQQYRRVPVKLKRDVWHNYGYDTTVGSYDAHRKDYEFDHLIPNCLGGASVKENIWPQPLTGPWNAHDKDKLERYVRLQVLHHKITLEQAQGMFTPNWIETYEAQFGPKPDAPALPRRITPPRAPRRLADDGRRGRNLERHLAGVSLASVPGSRRPPATAREGQEGTPAMARVPSWPSLFRACPLIDQSSPWYNRSSEQKSNFLSVIPGRIVRG